MKIENKEFTETLLAPDEPAPFVILNADSILPVLLVCDHASNRFPRSLGTMGLDYLNRVSHIALDIGANAIAEALADNLGATAVLCQYSRLIVDCNRNLIDDSAFLKYSDGVDVPGNHNLQSSEKEKRVSEIYWPYHNAIKDQIVRLKKHGIDPVVISIHSFTPVINGNDREWEMGVLWDKDPATAEIFLTRLVEAGFWLAIINHTLVRILKISQLIFTLNQLDCRMWVSKYPKILLIMMMVLSVYRKP